LTLPAINEGWQSSDGPSDKQENAMNGDKTTTHLRGVGVSSVIFGILGWIFYWWLPLGMVWSLTGLVLGFVDWTMARRRSLDYRLSIAGILLSLGALALNIVIASLGLQTVTFGSLR
jgi:hypothetical protein